MTDEAQRLAALIRERCDELYEHAYDFADTYVGNTLTFADMAELAEWLLARGVTVNGNETAKSREPSEPEIEAAREASAERFTPPQPNNLLGRRAVIAMLRAAFGASYSPEGK
jgi:hypothetical protein